MKTEKDIVPAIKARIKQLQGGIKVLNRANGPYVSRAIMEAVEEELQTLLKWIINDKEETGK
jgi:hypothetical protein